MPTDRTTPSNTRENTRRDRQVLDESTFHRLVTEGQELRRAFDSQTAKTRLITPDDMKTRSR